MGKAMGFHAYGATPIDAALFSTSFRLSHVTSVSDYPQETTGGNLLTARD